MNDPRLKLFFLSAAAQCAATAVFIASNWAYWRLFNKESWPVIIPSLIVALVSEALILSFALQARNGATKPFAKIMVAAITSWIGGLVCFLALEGAAKALFFNTPKIAWLVALLVVFFLVRRVNATWSNSPPL